MGEWVKQSDNDEEMSEMMRESHLDWISNSKCLS